MVSGPRVSVGQDELLMMTFLSYVKIHFFYVELNIL